MILCYIIPGFFLNQALTALQYTNVDGTQKGVGELELTRALGRQMKSSVRLASRNSNF